MALEVRDLDEQSERAWELYVDRHPEGTLFHTLLWRDAVREAFRHRARYLAAWRGETCVGVFPLMQVGSYLAGTILVSVPYAVYGGSLADDAEAHAALLDRAREMAAQLKAQWIDIRSVTPQWPDLPVVRRYVTFRKRLPNEPGRVLNSLPRKARAAARQARELHRLEASFDDAHLDTVWSLYSRSMRRLASPNYPLKFFRYLVEHTPPMRSGDRTAAETHRLGHTVQLVRYKGQAIAGLVSFVYRGTLMPYFSGCDDSYEKTHPNNFMYLTAMEQGVETGCREFDFGRSRVDNAGAYNFKRFQGFEPTPLHYQYYVPDGGREPDLHPDNAKLSLARRVWPRLPLAVTRPLGSWLARSIPG